MGIEIFNRYENKYLLDVRTFHDLLPRLSEYMEPDAYNEEHETYTIANLYYDTADSHLIRTSLAKPSYKEKLRLRAYDVPLADAQVYVEIKKKVRGLVNKRRSAMTLEEAYQFLQTGEIPEWGPTMNVQVLNEIGYMLERYALRPAMYLAYDRRAYFGLGEHDLRVSFDRNIRYRQTELSLEAGDHGRQLLGPEMLLMEIKSSRGIPVWLARLLAECRVYPCSFSKYGVAYLQTLSDRLPNPVYQCVPCPSSTAAFVLA